MTTSARAMGWGAILSVALHVLIALLLPRASDLVEWTSPPIELEVSYAEQAGDGHTTIRAGAPELVLGGGESPQNIDVRDRGQGGQEHGAREVVLLMSRADQVTLSDSPMNALGTAQAQRIETARDRASLEDRRSTTHPDDDVFLASGAGIHPERRPNAEMDPIAGARSASAATEEGGVEAGAPGSAPPLGGEGGPPAHDGNHRAPAPRQAQGAPNASPGRGIASGRGARESEAARIAHGRPTVDLGSPSTLADTRDPRVRDDVDAELLAARMMQSVVDSTTRRGRTEGEGSGGTGTAGAPGSGGGQAEGGRAHALGPGRGRWDALDTRDSRYRRWFVETSRRVQDALVFPRNRMLAMDQGSTLVAIRVRRDGTLAGAPRVVRSSGFSDLDGAAIAAIQQALPFSPIPDDLAPGLATLAIRMPIEFSNPMVQ